MKDENEIEGTAVVCALTSDTTEFTDNFLGSCYFCQRLVQHRPHVPTPHTLVCRICFMERVEEGDEIMASPESFAEVLAQLMKTHK